MKINAGSLFLFLNENIFFIANCEVIPKLSLFTFLFGALISHKTTVKPILRGHPREGQKVAG